MPSDLQLKTMNFVHRVILKGSFGKIVRTAKRAQRPIVMCEKSTLRWDARTPGRDERAEYPRARERASTAMRASPSREP